MSSENEKWLQNNVGYIKISSKRCPVAIIYIFARYVEVQLGRHGGDKRGKERTTERQGRKSSPKWNRFETFRRRKSEMFHSKCFVSILRIVLPMSAGSTIPEKSRKKKPESENLSQNNVGYIKRLPKWGRIHEDGIKIMSDTSLKSPTEATCSKNTHNCNVF